MPLFVYENIVVDAEKAYDGYLCNFYSFFADDSSLIINLEHLRMRNSLQILIFDP